MPASCRALARFAVPRAPLCVHVDIVGRERVPVLTVCLGRVSGVHGFAAQQVFFARYRFQVIWIDAMPYSAQVIKLKTGRDGAPILFPRYTVGKFRNPIRFQLSVPGARLTCSP